MTGRFTAATAVDEVTADTPDGSTAPRRFTAAIAEGWDIVGNANGGYLMAIAGRALVQATGRPDPVTITGHYLSPGRPGPLRIEVDELKVGRRFSTARATLAAEVDGGPDKPLLAVLATLGDLSYPGEDLLISGAPPVMPPPEDCVQAHPDSDFPPFMEQVDLRIPAGDAGFTHGEPTGKAFMQGWFRLRDGEPVDTVALLCAVDAFPPTIFNANLPVAWTPTVELTAHVRRRPPQGWLACRYASRFITGGFLEADGEVWDENGRLVAQSRQLALVPRPESGI